MDRNYLINQLKGYTSIYKEEIKFVKSFLRILEKPDCFLRSSVNGHVTGSAWIVDENFESVLLTHHKKLNKWLQLGGHTDGEENVLLTSEKEAREESGLTSLGLLNDQIFDIDIHLIPHKKNVIAHYHYDIRYLFQAKSSENLIISNESIDLKWVPLNQLDSVTENNASIIRMKEKTIAIRNHQPLIN